MIIVLEEEVANIELTEETVMVIETYDFDLPSGIVAGTLTEAGSMIVALGDSYPDETGAPTGDNQAWVSDLSLPKKGRWQSLSSGGGGGLLNNKSGVARVTGTVVILDGANDKAFVTTTTVADPNVIGVTAEDISANTDGQVKTLGRNTVLVQGNVARGEWLVASATEGRAQAAGLTRPANAIGIALEAYAGGGAGSVSAWVDAQNKLASISGTVLGTSDTQTITNKRITARVGSTTSSATPTINTDDYDAYSITALAADITSFTTNLSGTPTNYQKLLIRIKDDGTARAIAWGTSFVAGGVTLPTATIASKILTVGFMYNTDNSLNKWVCIASAQEA